MKLLYPNTNYVVFDFETTGLDHRVDDVIQMSAIKFIGDKKESFNRFVKTDSEIPEVIQSLTGINKDLLNAKGVNKQEAWQDFNSFISFYTLVGHNAISFDRMFLEKSFTDYSFKVPSTNRYIDTAMLYKAEKIGEKQMYYENHFDFCRRIREVRAYGVRFKLTICCEDLGIDMSQFTAHRSDSDIEMTNLIYLNFINKI